MRDKFILTAAVLLLLLPSVSVRAASFYMEGVCYSDPVVIVEVWESRFPMVDQAGGNVSFVPTAPHITAVSPSGVMTYQINTQKISNGSVVTGSVNTQQLMDCTASLDLVSTGRIDRTVIIIGAVFACLFGFNVGRTFFPDKFGAAG